MAYETKAQKQGVKGEMWDSQAVACGATREGSNWWWRSSCRWRGARWWPHRREAKRPPHHLLLFPIMFLSSLFFSSSLLPLFPFNFLSLPQREPRPLLLILLLVSSFFLRLEPWDWLASFSFFFPSNFLDSLARRSFGYDHLAPPIFFNVGNEPFWCLVAPVHKEWGKMHEMQLIAPFVTFSMATVMDKTKKTTGIQRSNNRAISELFFMSHNFCVNNMINSVPHAW